MGLEIKHTGTRGTFSGQHQFIAFPSVLRTLVWLWVIATVFAIKPAAVQGYSAKTVRKESPKGKTTAPTPPIRKLTKIQSEPPADAMERREHVTHQTKAGDTLLELLSRFGLPNCERQLWSRSIQRNIGTRGLLPAGKEVHFYFTRLMPGSRQSPQLRALEVDFSDTSTLTWEKGIRGILFQRREKPYDVELKTVSASVENSLFADGQKA